MAINSISITGNVTPAHNKAVRNHLYSWIGNDVGRTFTPGITNQPIEFTYSGVFVWRNGATVFVAEGHVSIYGRNSNVQEEQTIELSSNLIDINEFGFIIVKYNLATQIVEITFKQEINDYPILIKDDLLNNSTTGIYEFEIAEYIIFNGQVTYFK